MKLNRRNTLIGLGSLVAGSGALIGTGAFSSVEADRSVTVNTAGDGAANIQLSAKSPEATVSDGTLSVDLSKINFDAVTDFGEVFGITNNTAGSSDINVHLEVGGDDSTGATVNGGKIENTFDGQTVEIDFTASGTSFAGSGNSITIPSGNTENVSIKIDTTGVDTSLTDVDNQTTLLEEVTIVANQP